MTSDSMERDLVLPPVFTPVRLRERGDAFAHAIAVAAKEGAGTLVHVGRFDLAEFAVVLEPEEPLARARLAFYAGMTALTEAIVANAPPETLIEIAWPDAVTINFGLVGGGRLAWPEGVGESDVPHKIAPFPICCARCEVGQWPILAPMRRAVRQHSGFQVPSERL